MVTSVTNPTYLLPIVHKGREDLARENLRTLERECDRAKAFAGNQDLAACVVHDVADIAEDHADLLRWVGAPRNLSLRRIFKADLEVAA